MAVFQLVLALLLGGVGLALLAQRLRVPWPAFLALAGAGLAFVPGIPDVALDPQLALALFVAPALVDAGYDTSVRDLRANWLPVGSLVLGAVTLTVAAVAAVILWMVPGLPWLAAVALGAIVAPPDAAAAAAVLREVRLPHRVTVILEGESMLNDASALLIYRLAVGAVATGVTAWTAPLLALQALGGAALGFALARVYLAVTARVTEVAPAVVLQFLGTFGVWLLAEALGLSAVLTMVAYAVAIARVAPQRGSARRRRATYAVWEVVIFVLNVLAFILIGLQLAGILARLDGQTWRYASVGAAVLGTAVAVRFAWVIGYYAVARWREGRARGGPRRSKQPASARAGVVIAWCGMRGILTLAAALALPAGFPQRDLIVFVSFCVVLGTLVLQGLTLRPLLFWLALPGDKSVPAEVALARTELAKAALAALEAADGAEEDEEAVHLLRREYRARAELSSRPDGVGRSGALEALRQAAWTAERARLIELRREERIGDDAFHQVEEELDWAEAELDGAEFDGAELDGAEFDGASG